MENVMRVFLRLVTILASVTCLNTAIGDSYDLSIPRKIRYCAVVAEVRIEWIRVQRAPTDKFDDLFCECTVLQGFKLPVATNRLILRLNFSAAPRSDYEGKTAVLFAFESDRGGFSPFGGKLGLVLTNQVYVERPSYKKFKYDELIREIKKITEANNRAGSGGPKATPLHPDRRWDASSVTTMVWQRGVLCAGIISSRRASSLQRG